MENYHIFDIYSFQPLYFIYSQNFTIDEENDVFLKDGVPFRYISGSFHYFRARPETWSTILRRMKAFGLNAVDM